MGRTWQGPACGPGRDLRNPTRPVHWPEGSRPISVALDEQLAGPRPHSDHPARAELQMYDRPDGRDVQRDGAGHAQVKVRSDRPQQPVLHDRAEVPGVINAPSQDGTRIHRGRGGGAQTIAVVPDADLTMADRVGKQYWTAEGPAPTPGPVCAHCGQPFTITGHGGGRDAKVYCGAKCRSAASHRRKHEQAALNDDSALVNA